MKELLGRMLPGNPQIPLGFHPSHGRCHQVDDIHDVLRKDAGPMEWPLWTPPFIDPVKWLRAASKFRPGSK